ncbi:hypothetical protein AOQ71_24250 [Bradyrhizobium manausense]|uniref:Uncharacterized protein n=1 Tax=Bradyrhizobium manausense TaxID=989370 RepID=A0A0R3DBI8_9BRAD|nr:hypothetical protein AOQ71_24250 [Bradyrhizobium manausense]
MNDYEAMHRRGGLIGQDVFYSAVRILTGGQTIENFGERNCSSIPTKQPLQISIQYQNVSSTQLFTTWASVILADFLTCRLLEVAQKISTGRGTEKSALLAIFSDIFAQSGLKCAVLTDPIEMGRDEPPSACLSDNLSGRQRLSRASEHLLSNVEICA